MLCTLYPNATILFVHVPWGASSIYLERNFGLIIISLFNLFFGSFDCFLHSLEVSSPCYLLLFAIVDPQCSLVSFEYSSLDLCMCSHLFIFGYAHFCGGTLTILAFLVCFSHFGNGCQWGRIFEGLKGIGLELGFMLWFCS